MSHYYRYLGFKKPPTILLFIMHRSACDGWAFLLKITMILRMSKRLRINTKFFVFLLCGEELHKVMELARSQDYPTTTRPQGKHILPSFYFWINLINCFCKMFCVNFNHFWDECLE
jgi:hypothetical protein